MPVADLLIAPGTVLTMDPAGRVLSEGFVAVTGDRIAAVGGPEEARAWTSPRTLDAAGGLILPGLVNTHTHAAMTLFRGLADDLPLMTWLNDHIFPAEARLDREAVGLGTRLACAEMILSGTTCFCDMYLFEDAVAEAAREAGMRAVVGEVLYDFPSPHYGPVEAGLAFTRELIARWRGDPLIRVAVEPHSPYLCAPELLQRSAELARAEGAGLVIHLAETAAEVATVRQRYGCTPVEHLARLGVLGPDLLACHCVVLTPEDMELLAAHDVKVAHNAESNMKLASGVAPIPELLARGVCVGIGTDGCASNNNLDLFGEMDTVAKLHKVRTLDPTVLDAATVLRLATIDGARALGLGEEIGSLEPGKRADIIVVDTCRPHLTPLYHPASQLVYAARGADVRHSVIDGRPVMVDRRVATLPVDDLMKEVRRWSRALQAAGGPAG